MDWQTWALIVGAILAFLVLKRLAFASPAKVRECLDQGAKVIDVRSREEFQQDHISGAINIPLGDLPEQIRRHVPHQEQPVLLHCLSGGRSGMAKSMLRRLGYRNVFNLGSLARARKLAARPAGKTQPR